MVEYADERNIQTAEQEWNSGIAFGNQSNTYALVKSLLGAADSVDTTLEDVFDSHHINSAEGEALDKFGELVQVDRQTNEADDVYRARIKAAFRVGNTSTTFDEFSQLAAEILNTDIQNIDFIPDYPAEIELSSDLSLIDNTDLTAEQLGDILSGAVPAGHNVTAVSSGTFRLKSDGETDDADAGLTSDSISTGGTLAADLV
jgi:hypothetical protein